ncbi:MAG: hypothetical protein ACUVWK_05215 [Nitrososphaerales archaeon]
MSTSVKISEEGKRILDKLQAKLVLATGKKVSQQELLDMIMKFPAEKEEELIKLLAGVKLPLSPKDIEVLMNMPIDWGVETKEEEVDEYLYGKRSKRKD